MISKDESWKIAASAARPSNKKGTIANSNLVLFAFATAFFSRIIDTLGAPAVINFTHFITVPLACAIALMTSKSHNNDCNITKTIISKLFLLLAVIIASAVVNEAGMINVILDFMLLAEPFLLLATIIYLPLSLAKFIRLRTWIFRFFWFHLLLVFVQKYILKTDTWHWIGMEGADRIQGVFFVSGSGHVVGCSVSLTFAIYYFVQAKKAPLWLRFLLVFGAITNILIADGKQVLVTFLIAIILLLLAKLNNIIVACKYILVAAILVLIFWWCITNLAAFSSFKTWIRPEIYGTDGEATLLKTSAFRIIPTHYDSILNWLLGLGPGHSVSRLGGWMLAQYADLLTPLGSTIHPASKQVWQAVGSSWLGSQSSMFSPLFGWAGIWGDLGLLGLATYLNLGFVVWQRVCTNDVSKFFLLTVVVFGLIFSQLEEPGYMLSVACIIGIQYQESRINRTKHKLG